MIGIVRLTSFLLITSATTASAACLKANVGDQIASGRLTVIRAHDGMGRPERPYILRLDASTCLDAEELDEAVKQTRTIHVFPADEAMLPAFRRLVGRAITVRGSPFAAHTVHHHAPIVMQVSKINQR